MLFGRNPFPNKNKTLNHVKVAKKQYIEMT